MPERLKTDGQGAGRARGDGRPRTIRLQNAGLFGRFFEGLATGGDARYKGLARLALYALLTNAATR